jgi:hypothetical protein
VTRSLAGLQMRWDVSRAGGCVAHSRGRVFTLSFGAGALVVSPPARSVVCLMFTCTAAFLPLTRQVFAVPREVAKDVWKQHRKAVAARVKQERHVAQNSTWTRRTHASGAPAPALPPPPPPMSATGANSIGIPGLGAFQGAFVVRCLCGAVEAASLSVCRLCSCVRVHSYDACFFSYPFWPASC